LSTRTQTLSEPSRRQTVQSCSEHAGSVLAPTAQRYGILATTSWGFVIFGEMERERGVSRYHQHGTILVDLATHRVVDLLPDRSATTVAAWLAQHPSITGISRDRSPLYADGIRQGAPDAVQVVDRFHLVDNLREAVEAFLRNQRGALQAAAARTAQALTPPGSSMPCPSPSSGSSTAHLLGQGRGQQHLKPLL
jgi:Transposase